MIRYAFMTELVKRVESGVEYWDTKLTPIRYETDDNGFVTSTPAGDPFIVSLKRDH